MYRVSSLALHHAFPEEFHWFSLPRLQERLDVEQISAANVLAQASGKQDMFAVEKGCFLLYRARDIGKQT